MPGNFDPTGSSVHHHQGASYDPVNHPHHYTQGRIECIDAIEAALGPDGFIAFLRGQVIKYNWRLSHKGEAARDSAKAAWYQARLTATLTTNDPGKN